MSRSVQSLVSDRGYSNRTYGTMREPFEPIEIDDASVWFPADVRHLCPASELIPDEFWFGRGGDTKWVKTTNELFFGGGRIKAKVKTGVDHERAIRHLMAILGSWDPPHECKTASVAYLASLWFKSMKIERVS